MLKMNLFSESITESRKTARVKPGRTWTLELCREHEVVKRFSSEGILKMKTQKNEPCIEGHLKKRQIILHNFFLQQLLSL